MTVLAVRHDAKDQTLVLACLGLWICTYLIFTIIDAFDIGWFDVNAGVDLIRIKRALIALAGAGFYWLLTKILWGFPEWRSASRLVGLGFGILIAACFLWTLRVGVDAAFPGDPLDPTDDAVWVAIWTGIFSAWLAGGARFFWLADSDTLDAKRLLDLSIAPIALVLFLPIMALTALAIRICLGSPVFFIQTRSGRHGKPFKLLKFRTMSVSKGSPPSLSDDEQRMTSLGRFLRARSLDELPQLWNVLRGEMSLVGPRPLLMHYMPHYTPRQARRHEIRPGITGWAQVNGRNEIDWNRKFELDLWYVQNSCFTLDLKILWMTLRAVCSGRGVTPRDSATTPFFVEPDN